MRKLRAVITSIVLSLTLFIPSLGWPWGWATHGYIALRLLEDKNVGDNMIPDIVYGSVLPDAFNEITMNNKKAADFLIRQTHTGFTRFTNKALGMREGKVGFGFLTHNERWGADFTAHVDGITTQVGYVAEKLSQIEPAVAEWLEGILKASGVILPGYIARQLSSDLSHQFIESAVDLVIKKEVSENVGQWLLVAASEATKASADVLCSAYGSDLAKVLKMNKAKACKIIRDAESNFRQLIHAYGNALDRDQSEAVEELAAQGALLLEWKLGSTLGKSVDIDPEDLRQFLLVAVDVVKGDCLVEVNETISMMGGNKSLIGYRNNVFP